MCGGFHPDYAVAWESGGKMLHATAATKYDFSKGRGEFFMISARELGAVSRITR